MGEKQSRCRADLTFINHKRKKGNEKKDYKINEKKIHQTGFNFLICPASWAFLHWSRQKISCWPDRSFSRLQAFCELRERKREDLKLVQSKAGGCFSSNSTLTWFKQNWSLPKFKLTDTLGKMEIPILFGKGEKWILLHWTEQSNLN